MESVRSPRSRCRSYGLGYCVRCLSSTTRGSGWHQEHRKKASSKSKDQTFALTSAIHALETGFHAEEHPAHRFEVHSFIFCLLWSLNDFYMIGVFGVVVIHSGKICSVSEISTRYTSWYPQYSFWIQRFSRWITTDGQSSSPIENITGWMFVSSRNLFRIILRLRLIFPGNMDHIINYIDWMEN